MRKSRGAYKNMRKKIAKCNFRSKRGWPTVGTGLPHIRDMASYCRWRRELALPEESADFSDRDAFDVAFHAQALAGARGRPRLEVKLAQLGPEALTVRERELLARRAARAAARERGATFAPAAD